MLCCGDSTGNEADSPCRKDKPCAECCAERDALWSDLLDSLVRQMDVLLRGFAERVASARLEHQAWIEFKKFQERILPGVPKAIDLLARVESALNRLPAALMAEPQCCQRMCAAVSCLAAASKALPLLDVKLEAVQFTRFMVPPFEEMPGTPHLLRCVELLEQGCTASFEAGPGSKLSWEERQDDVEFSDQNSVASSEHNRDRRALGTPMKKGSVEFTILRREGGNDFWVGVALQDCLDINNDEESGAITMWTYRSGVPNIRGTRGQAGDDNNKKEFQTGDKIHVKYDGSTVEFYVIPSDGAPESKPRFTEKDVSGPVRPLVIFSEAGAVQIDGFNAGSVADEEDQGVTRLTVDKATEPLPALTIHNMSTWEARVFGSLCVAPYVIGDLDLRQLAAGELTDVTLIASEGISRDSAFLAHFVARSCKSKDVNVQILHTGFQQSFILRPGGGVEAHVRTDSKKAGSAARDRVLALSNMNVSIDGLHLLMEAALAGLPEAATSDNLADADNAMAPANDTTDTEEAEEASAQLSKSLETGELSWKLESLAASKTNADGERSLYMKDVVQSVELNQNPLVGHGKGRSMKLIVQLAHLAAGRYLMQMHLDNSNIEDEGIRVLTHAFNQGFAPRLKILWLSDNSITDVGAQTFGTALQSSLECLTELYLFRFC